MAVLPSLNQQAQGLNVQQPQVPSVQQSMATTRSRATPAMGARPFSNMAPDNGQHGGAPRYMTPQSGAMTAAARPAVQNPYSGSAQRAQYPQMGVGGSGILQQPQGQPQAPSARPFDPNRLTQVTQAMQAQMPFNNALRERFLNSPQQGQMAPQAQGQGMPGAQPLPPMFSRY